MNDAKKSVIDIIKVTFSNIIKLFAGVALTFVLPKLVDVSDFGYYKTFTLYASYCGLFGFGLIDGIYLKYGGKNYEDLERERFRYYSRFFIASQIIISIVLFLFACFSLHGEARFIVQSISIYILAFNITGYYQMISQITSRFDELAKRNIIQSVLFIVCTGLLCLFYKYSELGVTYKYFVLMHVLIYSALSINYLGIYRDITFGRSVNGRKDIQPFVILGIPLLVANLTSTLLLSIDRQFVSILFSTEEYATYAFAYNMLQLITTATSAISLVLYPNIKKKSFDELVDNYDKLMSIMVVFMSGCLLSYFPLYVFVDYFLHQYIESLFYFRYILPGLSISSCITIVMYNYYKAFNLTKNFFYKSVIALALAVLFNFIAYFLFKSREAISIASVLVSMIWYLIVERKLVKENGVKWKKNNLYLIATISSFYLITLLNNPFIAMFAYIGIYMLVTVCFYKKDASSFLDALR